jgi:formate dehydrogenase iron-sulfur subunit
VVYDSKKCIGCRYCQYACPFGVPTYDWNNPLGLIHKCQMCVERLAEGEMPACVSSCPAGALRFGRRSDLLVQAHARINSNSGRYIDQVYGEFEAGGTSVLYLSGVPFSQLGLPDLGDQTISHYAEAVMKKTPVVAASVAALATGLYWLTKRRDLHLSEAQVTLPQEDRHDH